MRRALLEAVAELEALGVFGEAGDELVVALLLHIEARRRNADLAGVAILEGGDDVGGLLRIEIVEHDDRRVAAQFHGGALHALGGQAGEMLADRNRAGEGNLAHDVGGDEVLRDLRRHAEHEVEHARRQAGIGEALHQFDSSRPGFLPRP